MDEWNKFIILAVLEGGGTYLAMVLALFFFYGIGRNIFLHFRFASSSRPNTRYSKNVISIFVVMGIFYVALILLALGIDVLYHTPNVDQVFNTSLKLISIEGRIFGMYPAIWFHSADNLSKPFWDSIGFAIIAIYRSLGLVMAISWLYAIYFNSKVFYKLTISWVLTTVISFPIWYLIPAISPQEIFIDNSLKIMLPPDLALSLAYFDPTPVAQSTIELFDRAWNSNYNGSFAITTFPSMHVAWATLLMYFMIRISKYFSAFFVPYWIGICLSTVYTLQHYAIDIPAGVIAAAVCILISEKLLRREPRIIRRMCNLVRTDINNIYFWWERKVSCLVQNVLTKKDPFGSFSK